METTIPAYQIKEARNLSPRIQWLRDYYFQGVSAGWNNEFTSWTTGTPWDFQYEEVTFHIVPETYSFLQTFRPPTNRPPARRAPPGFLDLEPAGAAGLVYQER